MDAAEALRRLAEVIDAHAWDDISALLHPDFVCELVATGERMSGPDWVSFNANYPGFQGMRLIEVVAAGDRAAARCHVTGVVDGRQKAFSVAQFATMKEGLLVNLVEVWADLDDEPPPGTR